MKNHVTSTQRAAKRKYITESIKKNVGNSAMMWKLLRNLLSNKNKNTNIQKMAYKGSEHTRSNDIANVLNDHFSSITMTRKQSIQFQGNVQQFMSDVNSTFSFVQVTPEEVLKFILEVPRNKATGLDTIPSSILKDSSVCILKPLTHILNLSLKEGHVPLEWKKARITPLFKGGDASNPINYRPISVLPVLSKVIEKLVFKQIYINTLTKMTFYSLTNSVFVQPFQQALLF